MNCDCSGNSGKLRGSWSTPSLRNLKMHNRHNLLKKKMFCIILTQELGRSRPIRIGYNSANKLLSTLHIGFRRWSYNTASCTLTTYRIDYFPVSEVCYMNRETWKNKHFRPVTHAMYQPSKIPVKSEHFRNQLRQKQKKKLTKHSNIARKPTADCQWGARIGGAIMRTPRLSSAEEEVIKTASRETVPRPMPQGNGATRKGCPRTRGHSV